MRLKDWFSGLLKQEHNAEVQFAPRQGQPAPYPRWSDTLPYLSYDPDTHIMVLSAPNLGHAQADKIEGLGCLLRMNTLLAADQNLVDQLVEITNADLPVGMSLAFHCIGSHDLSTSLDGYQAVRQGRVDNQEQGALLNALTQKRIEFFKKGAHQSPFKNKKNQNAKYLFRNFELYLSITYPLNADADDENTLIHAIGEFKKLCDRMVAGLSALNLCDGDSIQTRDQIMDLITRLSNPVQWIQGKHEIRNCNAYEPIASQVVRHATTWVEHKDHLVASEQNTDQDCDLVVMGVEDYPKEWFINGMGELIGSFWREQVAFSCPFMITTGFIISDPDQLKMVMIAKKQSMDNYYKTPLGGWLDETREHKEDYDQAVNSLEAGIGLNKMFMSVVLFSSQHQRLIDIENAKNVFKTQGFHIEVASGIQKLMWLANLPLVFTSSLIADLSKMNRLRTFTSINNVCLSPLLAEHRGMGAPVVLTWGRRGQAQHIDLFANTAGNYNATVTGASGSGKSTFMNAMGLANLECGGQNFIIDVGRSYEKQVQLLKGQYLVFNQSSNVCLNPLDLIDSIAEDAEMAGAVIAQMASPNHPLSAYQTTRIEDAIKLLFELKQQGEIEWMSIDQLADLLIHNRCFSNEAPFDRRQDERLCDMNIREIGICLGRYCPNGVYGAWFNGRNNIKFNTNLVVLELEELGQFPDLQAVVMLILMQQITGIMYLGDRSIRKVLMIDEAWDLFKKGSMMAAGIEKAYRRARKYEGSCITGTQSIQDYFANDATRAAFQSSDWMFMLRQKEDAIVSLMNNGNFTLNEYQLSLFRSLKTVSGQYSEVLVRCADQAFIGRHILSPRDLLLFSSKAEDFVAVKNYNDQGLSMDQAIERVLRDRGLVSGQVETSN